MWYEECELDFCSLRIPIPEPITIQKPNLKKNSKIKRYKITDKVLDVYRELERLNRQGYTHVANMPGKLNEIFYYAQRMHIIVLDKHLVKYIADYCTSNEGEKT